jgi:WD40 repeat protein
MLLQTPEASGGFMSSSVAFAPDGRTVVEGWGDARYTKAGEYLSSATNVSLLDVEPGQERKRLVLPSDEVCAVAFSPDGQTLAVGLGSEVKLYDAVKWQERQSLKAEIGFYFCQLAFSSDGRKLAAAAGHSVIVWDLTTNRVVFSPRVNARMVYGVAISPDGRFVAAAAEGPVVCRPIGPFGLFGVACGSEGGRVRLWDLEAEPDDREFTLKGTVYAVAFSPDGRTLASGGWDGARIRSLSGGRERKIFTDPVFSLAYALDGHILALGLGKPDSDRATGEVRLWDAQDGGIVAVLQGNISRVRSLAFSAGSRSLVAGSSRGVVLWDVPVLPIPGPPVGRAQNRAGTRVSAATASLGPSSETPWPRKGVNNGP